MQKYNLIHCENECEREKNNMEFNSNGTIIIGDEYIETGSNN